MKKLRLLIKILVTSLALGIIIYIIVANTVPFNVSKTYVSNGKDVLVLGPPNRVEKIKDFYRQVDDLIYFSNRMPLRFDHSSIMVTFKNKSQNQIVTLGYKDQTAWHFNSRILDAPFLDNITWPRIGSGPFLYQKTPTFKSVGGFLNNPPVDKNIGVFDYTDTGFLHPNTKLHDYKPITTDTSINIPLRGSSTLYTYLKNEPFHMTFTKQDLNWYADPDVMKISVYKQQTKVFDATIDDDGDSSADHHVGPTQSISINNPGPSLPEAGIYKIVIDSAGDSVLTNITTNLHKIVFDGPINPVANTTVFPGLVNKTQPTSVYTNATDLTTQTYHSASLQTLTSSNQKFILKKASQDLFFNLIASTEPVKLTAPQSDVVINGNGYFAFSPDQFFAPVPYKILQISNSTDLNHVDYVLTNYPGVTKLIDGWEVANREFNLSDAILQKGNLSWLLSAPGLKNNNGSVEYKQIQMTLSKKGWYQH